MRFLTHLFWLFLSVYVLVYTLVCISHCYLTEKGTLSPQLNLIALTFRDQGSLENQCVCEKCCKAMPLTLDTLGRIKQPRTMERQVEFWTGGLQLSRSLDSKSWYTLCQIISFFVQHVLTSSVKHLPNSLNQYDTPKKMLEN